MTITGHDLPARGYTRPPPATIWPRRHPAVAGVAREPAQAVPAAVRHAVDVKETVRRVADPALFARPIVVTNGQYRFLVAEQLAAIGAEGRRPARALTRDDGAVVVALAADHVVTYPAAFAKVCTLPAPPPRRIGSSCSASSRRGTRGEFVNFREKPVTHPPSCKSACKKDLISLSSASRAGWADASGPSMGAAELEPSHFIALAIHPSL